MTPVVAGIALFIAFVSIWLATTTLKKMEEGNRSLEQKLTEKIEELQAAVEKRISTMDKRVGAFDDKMETIIQGQMDAQATTDGLRRDLDKLQEDFDTLKRRIPPNILREESSESYLELFK